MGRFRDRMDEDLRIRGYSAHTRACYLRCVRHFVRHFMRPPDQLTPEHIRQYQRYLTRDRPVSWPYFNQVVCAFRFFYRQVLKKDWAVAAPRVTDTRRFAAVAETLAAVAVRRLGAQIALTAILHTWTQLLLFPPHLHCIVPGGGLDPRHTHWISTRPDCFLPVRVLAEVFRGKLLAKLETAIDRAQIPRPREADLHARLKRAATQRWGVYGKRPFAGPDQVLADLARYTHRIALSNDRLVSLHAGQVTFRWKDRAHGNASRVTTLEADTFLRRFLLHVLPHRFVRIRHYGQRERERRWVRAHF